MTAFFLCSLLGLALLPLGARGQETNSNRALDLESFRIIARKNIFNASRHGLAGPHSPVPVVRQIVLLGLVDDYGTGAAWFSGSHSLLKTGNTIHGVKITKITLNSVELASGSNTFVLTTDGSRSLRSEDNGPWQLADAPAPEGAPSNAAPDSTAAAPASPAPGGESDILKKLRLKREQEDK